MVRPQKSAEVQFTCSPRAVSGASRKWRAADSPGITGVSLDPLSTITPTSLTWDANSVFINVASQFLPLDSRILINVVAVPEPTIFAMLLGAIGLPGFCGRRRGRPAVEGVRMAT